jgi:hypothetical protein
VRIYAKTPGAKTLEKTLAPFARGRGESSYVEAEGLDVGVGGDALRCFFDADCTSSILMAAAAFCALCVSPAATM